MSGAASSGKIAGVSLTPEQRAIKRAFEETVKGCGGLEAAEEYCRVSATQLQRYCSPNTDAFPTLDVIADLEPLAMGRPNAPHVTRYLARNLGYTLVERPTVDAAGCANLHAALRVSMQRSADLHAGIVDALSDGTTTAIEAGGLLSKAMAAAEENLRTHALLMRIADEC